MIYFSLDDRSALADSTFTLNAGEQEVRYVICGVFYYANNHFTTRIIRKDGSIWFYDGISAPEGIPEGLVQDRPASCQHMGDATVLQSRAADIPFLLEYMPKWLDEKLWAVATIKDRLTAVRDRLCLKEAAGTVRSTSFFPLEIWGEIVQHSDLFTTLAAIATTCLRLHQLINHDLEHVMVKVFDMVGLDWVAVRFMLRGAHGLLVGEGALCMLFPSCGYSTFENLGTMEFFANRKHVAWMLMFMIDALGWELVFRAPLTSDFGHFDGTRLVIPYAARTRRGIAIPNLAFEQLVLDIGPSLGLASERRAARHNIRVRGLTTTGMCR
ncbi:hypothetical protein C8F01DRAFT_1083815 [Mycena amicta]|nr:hypothetical protein C8F01DRAFT_1083815 [Mycena amicta]